MKFLVLILVLGVRRLDTGWPFWLANPHRHQGWLQQWSNRLGPGQRVWWLAVLLPAVLVSTLACWLDGFWGQLLVLLLGIVLLLWLVGVHSEFRHVDELLVRGRMNDPDGFAALAADEFGVNGTPGQSAYQQELVGKILSRELQLFIAIFWLVLLGPGAAFLVVLNRVWVDEKGEEGAGSWQSRLNDWLCWPANKLLLLSMALAGDFTAVMEKMRGRWLRRDPENAVLQDVATIALEEPLPAQTNTLSTMLDHLESLQGLLLRCVAIWLILSALWIIVI
ncbi:MAG: hypothetical protein VX793_10185 [Pseudomonadota bacterium]|nr:hypothetical protein [Pseudomonadota bacterium]